MKTNNLYLDIYAIQSVPPSNLNRDDTGSPKTAQYGGVTRARVSSQCWKKAMRDYFLSHGDAGKVGVRTKDIVTYVAEKIREKNNTKSVNESMEMADKIINMAGVKTKDYKAKALFFLGNKQAEELAMAALKNIQDKKEIQGIMNANPAVDIALFGRMLADDQRLNEDASCQVAHAISTHAVSGEYDYFTAIDDLSPEGNVGAEMIGMIEYNSSTLYRYANIAVHELCHQLGNKEAAISAVTLFIEAVSYTHLTLPTTPYV